MPTSPTFDLQAHSTASDGELAAADVVAAAAQAGVKLLALTDHDSVAGVDEALNAAGSHPGLELVTGVEISTRCQLATPLQNLRSDDLDSGDELITELGELHICGYGLDHNDPSLLAQLTQWQTAREDRAGQMVKRLVELGWQIDLAEIQDHLGSETAIGRPHIAQAIFRSPANSDRLEREALSDPTDFLVAYLIKGTPGFTERELPSSQKAIEVIHAAGGIAVWAHPFWDVKESKLAEAAVEQFVSWGIDGLEVFYIDFDRQQTNFLHQLAVKHDLYTTGSADFHGPQHRLFSEFRNFSTFGLDVKLPDSWIYLVWDSIPCAVQAAAKCEGAKPVQPLNEWLKLTESE